LWGAQSGEQDNPQLRSVDPLLPPTQVPLTLKHPDRIFIPGGNGATPPKDSALSSAGRAVLLLAGMAIPRQD
jgi:hypothetical protein